MGFAACAAALRAAGLFGAADGAFIPPAAQLLCGSLLAAAPFFLQPLLPSFSILLFLSPSLLLPQTHAELSPTQGGSKQTGACELLTA